MLRLQLLFPYLLFGVIVLVVVLANVPAESPSGNPPEHLVCAPCGMTVDPQTAIARPVDGQTQYFCSTGCYQHAADSAPARKRAGAPHVDVVCNMEVNPTWNINAHHEGTRYSFCTQRCKAQFEADPATWLTPRCLVCKASVARAQTYPATYLGHTYLLCSADHRQEFKADPASFFMHSMWGIPSWLYYTSIALVLLVSFGVFDWLSRSSSTRGYRSRTANASSNLTVSTAAPGLPTVAVLPGLALPVMQSSSVAGALAAPRQRTPLAARFDLFDIRWLRAAARSRGFRFVLQLVVVALFGIIIAAGWWGNQNPALNIAPLLTWTVWWGLLPVLILFAGKAWCYVCPWDAVAGWVEKLRFWEKAQDGLSLNYRWPRVVRNISIATVLFVGLTWVELGFGVTMKPRVTAALAVGMLFLAILAALLFEKKSFCRYGCLVGRVSGLYALFGGAEVRSRDGAVCRACHTKECVSGSDTAYGCPTLLYPGNLKTNTYCIQCMECVQACPHDNLALNLRPWAADLAAEGRPRTDEAYLALLMLSITGFHGLTMTPAWQQLIDWIRGSLDIGRVIGFTLGMAGIMLAPIAVYAGLVWISRQLGRQPAPGRLNYRDYFIRYAYALLPIALFYHIAHNLEHLLMEGPKVLALASDPFGWNWNLFGTADWNVPPLISLGHLWLVQALLVLIGHVYSLWVAQQISLRLFHTAEAARRSQLPMLIAMIAFSIFSLWLLKQPMEMRTSAM